MALLQLCLDLSCQHVQVDRVQVAEAPLPAADDEVDDGLPRAQAVQAQPPHQRVDFLQRDAPVDRNLQVEVALPDLDVRRPGHDPAGPLPLPERAAALAVHLLPAHVRVAVDLLHEVLVVLEDAVAHGDHVHGAVRPVRHVPAQLRPAHFPGAQSDLPLEGGDQPVHHLLGNGARGGAVDLGGGGHVLLPNAGFYSGNIRHAGLRFSEDCEGRVQVRQAREVQQVLRVRLHLLLVLFLLGRSHDFALLSWRAGHCNPGSPGSETAKRCLELIRVNVLDCRLHPGPHGRVHRLRHVQSPFGLRDTLLGLICEEMR